MKIRPKRDTVAVYSAIIFLIAFATILSLTEKPSTRAGLTNTIERALKS
jgi:hypothetical protein